MTEASARAIAVSGVDRLGAHAALWYGQARYRLAWLVLPQAAVALMAGLALALVGTGAEWGKPADSKESEKLYADLLEKAGKDGDKAAFDKLKAAAMEQLKGVGNALLGAFGLSLDSFVAERDEATGAFSVRMADRGGGGGGGASGGG